MSVKVMGQVWDLDLPAPKLLVLLALADHADHNGNNVYPSIELVAWKTGYSETQTRRIIKGLVKDGLLKASPRPGKTTMYSMRLAKGKKKAVFKRKGYQNETPVKKIGVALDDTPTPVIAMTPEPSFEPSKESVAKPQRPQKPIYNAIAQHVFGLTEMKGINGGRIAKLEKIARSVAIARMDKPTDEKVAALVVQFASTEKFKPAIQGTDGFELKFAAYLDKTQGKVEPLNVPSVLDGLRLVS